MARVQILSKEEQKIFSSPPKFNFSQKEYYFKLPEAIQKFLTTLRDSNNQTYFSLLYGYYKASSIFYPIEDFHNIQFLFQKSLLQALDLSPKDLQGTLLYIAYQDVENVFPLQ